MRSNRGRSRSPNASPRAKARADLLRVQMAATSSTSMSVRSPMNKRKLFHFAVELAGIRADAADEFGKRFV